ncbi:cytochrome c (plasmid) [Azospirillum humicireducens]|uniref:Cytochrome c n=1 Tax=Azospirillum humicireducens TaxID=1226968 RepID=A0A2R4VX11_9PROT|nr:c-type cytochrome [Azospirillum humicireducens]AWB08974.1 cytochrome c [Azospirillum humicireducens]
MHAKLSPHRWVMLLLLLSIPVSPFTRKSAAAEGETLFRQQCGACHTVKKDGGPRAGPPLFGVIGRKAGSAAGFKYSDALRGAGFAWDAGHLERWLANSNEFLPGSYMNYRQEDGSVRKSIVNFLETSATR